MDIFEALFACSLLHILKKLRKFANFRRKSIMCSSIKSFFEILEIISNLVQGNVFTQ